MFNVTLLDHFQHPRNPGHLDPPAITVEASNPACGDILKLFARIEDGRLAEVRYQARGCTASIAAGSALTELITGRTLASAATVTAADIDSAVGGLPTESKHVAALCLDALKLLLRSSVLP